MITNKFLASVAIITALFSMTSCAVAQTRANPDSVSGSVLDATPVFNDKQAGKIVEQGQPSPDSVPESLPESLPGKVSPPPQSQQTSSAPPTSTDSGGGADAETLTDLQASNNLPDIAEALPAPITETGMEAGTEIGTETGPETETTTEPARDEHPHTWPIDISDQFTEIIAGVPIIENPEKCGQGDLEVGVIVSNIPKSKGVIVADLHDDVRENFLVWDKVVLRVRAHAHKGEISFCMPLTRPGDYAIAVYHDKNGNKEFDKNFLGIPKERFGMSNNPRFGTRSPKYEEAVFTVSETGKDILIKLRKASDVLGRQD